MQRLELDVGIGNYNHICKNSWSNLCPNLYIFDVFCSIGVGTCVLGLVALQVVLCLFLVLFGLWLVVVVF